MALISSHGEALRPVEGDVSSFHVVNLGCKVNRVESDDFAARLMSRGASLAAASDAELIIVNTCTVTGEAEKKTRKAVRQALRTNEHARVVVTGCAVAIDPDTYTAMSDRVSVVPKGELTRLFVEYSNEYDNLDERERHAESLRVGRDFPTRVGVKVQDGCNNACTYCIVHVARGKAWSRPLKEVVEESCELAAAGVKEIVLTGINLGSYAFEGATLASLLRALLAATPEDVRFRVSSVEPRDVDDDLIETMVSSNGRVCRHLHLPLQSGSARVLKEMARPYKVSYFEELVAKLYAAMPTLSLSTDIIVGFPGETEEDFLETCRVARACRFSKIHVFRYSKREGTPAARREDQVAPEVKADRAKRLEALGDELRCCDFEARKGTREYVLVETDGVATTESYHTVEAPEGSRPGDVVECVL